MAFLRKIAFTLGLGAIAGILQSCGDDSVSTTTTSTPIIQLAVPLIIDTDFGGGGCMCVDDVAALCMAHALADKGEVNLLAVIQNTPAPELAGAISVLNRYYGRDDVPIGAYKGSDLYNRSAHSFVFDLATNWSSPIKNSTQVPSGVEVYRKVLAAQPDHSVVISSIGLSVNLAELLKSTPDKHSPYSGLELVARKVQLLAVMGGNYPRSGSRPECNFAGASAGKGPDHVAGANSTAYVLAHWPPTVRILFSGLEVGEKVWTGAKLETCAPASNPCRQAFVDWWQAELRVNATIGMGWWSWDPLTTLMAVRGPAAAGCSKCTDCDGVNKVYGTIGQNEWVLGPPSNQSYVVLHDAKTGGDAIDDLLCTPPANSPLDLTRADVV